MRALMTSVAPLTVLAARLAAHFRPLVLPLGAALFGLTVIHRGALQAGQLIQYMQVPASGTMPPSQVFTLPGYGNVQASVTNVTATYFDQLNAYNQSAGPYFWGTDTQRLGVLNSTSAPQNYTLTFGFLSGAPNPADLTLEVIGLANGTTATVSQPGSLVAEYTFPPSGFYPAGPPSTTNLTGLTFGSNNNADPLNTGWAIYQPSGSFTSLSLLVNQISGDGIGFTLGYVTPEPSSLVLATLGFAGLAAWGWLRRKRRA